MQSEANTPSKGDKTRVRQSAIRAVYDKEVLYQILDAALIGHVAFMSEGWPQSIPTAIARLDDRLYLHGSRKSRLYQTLAKGDPVCVSVCMVDALVKARSAFHCSMNYRSAVIFSRGEVVSGDEKALLLDRYTERLIPGTEGNYREPLAKELKATELIGLSLDDYSAKVRIGDPVDDEQDTELPYWAGVIPLHTVPGVPVAAADLPNGVELSDSNLHAIQQLQAIYAGRG